MDFSGFIEHGLNTVVHYTAVSGTQRDFGEYIGWLNNWKARDAYAHSHNTFDNGRFSFDGAVHGKWYCAMKR